MPSYAATDFEQVMKETFPKLFNSGRNILYHLTTMLSPATLTKRYIYIYIPLCSLSCCLPLVVLCVTRGSEACRCTAAYKRKAI